jgi:hypothetical protein
MDGVAVTVERAEGLQSGTGASDSATLVAHERSDRLPPVPIVVAAIVAAEIVWLVVLLGLGARFLL